MKSLKSKVLNILIKITLTSVLFTSCITQKQVMLLQDKNSKEIKTSFENKKKTEYQIQSGDYLYIRIYSLDPKTSKFFQTDMPTLMNPTYLYLNSYMVDDEGYINFSFVDRMFVKGMTLDEVKKKIQKTLNEFFNETTVVVKLVNFQISVMGEVGSPGTFTIDRDQINIFQALAMAGGMKDFSNINKVTLVRQTLKGSDIHYVDLSDKNILESDYFYLMPNDIVYVEPRNSKTYLFNTFPYGIVFGTISLVLTIYLYFQIK